MKKIFILVAVVVFAISTNSCTDKYKKAEDRYTDDYYTDTLLHSTVKFEDYKATRTVYTDLINTTLELKPIWEKSYLNGIATITAKPHFYPSDSLILDAKGMTINSVTLDGKILQYTYNNDVLKITLDRTYTRNESYKVQINYVAKPNERTSGGGNAVTSDKGLYFINPTNEKGGFMPQIWTQGETESNSVWFPTIDSPNMKSTQDVYITVDKKYVTLSNGKLVSSTHNSDGTRTDYWKQEKAHSVYLFMIGIGEFAVVEDFYTKKDGTKIPVNYYVEPEWKDQARAIFGKTPQMITFFSNLLGVDYPWDKYSQIVVREYVSGAMENTGAVVFGDYCYRTTRELLDENDESTIAHELFHHWFGDLVTAESWSNLPLNESFANFSQYLWDEYAYGKDLAQYNKDKDLNNANQGFNHPPIWFHYSHPDDVFDGISYNKGGAILQQLRAYLGDEAFFAGLNLYLTRYAHKTAEMHNLRMVFEEITGEDLNWYFNQWFFEEKTYPNVIISYSYNPEKTKVNLMFDQADELFVIPMTVMYVDDQGKHTKSFRLTHRNDTVSFDIKGTLQTIIIDPERSLLGYYNFDMPADFALKQYEYATNYRAKKEAIDNYMYKKVLSNQIDTAFINKALNDSFYGTQLAVLSEIRHDEYNKSRIETLISPAKLRDLIFNGKHHLVKSAALELYCESSSFSKENKISLLDEISKKEQSYSVLSAVLEQYLALAPEVADVKIDEFLLSHASPEINYIVAGYYLQNPIYGKIEFFKDLYKNASIRDKWNALLYYGYYAPAGGLDEVQKYLQVVEGVFDQTGHYREYILNRIFDLRDMLLNEERQLEKEKNIKEIAPIKKVREAYDAFINQNSKYY